MFSINELKDGIARAWEARDDLGPGTQGEARETVVEALRRLDRGELRVAEKNSTGGWDVNAWLKQAVLLSFRLNNMGMISGGPGESGWGDKGPSKFAGWG